MFSLTKLAIFEVVTWRDLRGEYDNASAKSILFTVLGVAAAIASGDPRVGLALGAFGQTAALKSLLKYSRTQESAADQAALNLLDATKQSASGLSSFLEVLGNQEFAIARATGPLPPHTPYLSRADRRAPRSPKKPHRIRMHPPPPASLEAHALMIAKLEGFLAPIGKVLRDYPIGDSSTAALVARAVAYHRGNRIAEADRTVGELLAQNPGNPYAQELQGANSI